VRIGEGKSFSTLNLAETIPFINRISAQTLGLFIGEDEKQREYMKRKRAEGKYQ